MKILTAIILMMLAVRVPAQPPSPGLTAVFDAAQNSVKLKWQQNDPDVQKYILQRSADNNLWKDIASLAVIASTKGRMVIFSDQKATVGKSYYRLKIYTDTNVYRYISPVMVIIGQAGSGWTMYPVPVTTMLNLQYNGTDRIPGVISVIIQSVNSGQILGRLRVASTTRLIQIPVSNLGRGVYDVRIYISDKVVWNQRFVK